MPNVKNWISELCNTTGTGDLVLTGALSGYTTWALGYSGSQSVWYTIKDGTDRESGTGTFNGTDTITRDTIHSTLVSGVYDDTSPVAITLSGASIVSCTLSEVVFDSKESQASVIELTTDTTLVVADVGNSYAITDALTVTLPVTTTLTVGRNLFYIVNEHSSPVHIRSSAFTATIALLYPGMAVNLDLVRNTSSGTGWSPKLVLIRPQFSLQ